MRAQRAVGEPNVAAICFFAADVMATFGCMLKHKQPHPNPPLHAGEGADRSKRSDIFANHFHDVGAASMQDGASGIQSHAHYRL